MSTIDFPRRLMRTACLAALLASLAAGEAWLNAPPPPPQPTAWLAEAADLIGPPAEVPGPALTVTKGDLVMAVGDMTTSGTALEHAMNQALAPSGANFALSAPRGIRNNGEHGVANHLIILKENILPRKPGIVAIHAGLFDANASSRNPEPDAGIKEYREGLTEMITTARAAGAKVVLLSPPLYGDDPGRRQNQRIPTFAAAMRDIAKVQQCPFVDVHALMRTALGKKKPTDPKAAWLTDGGATMSVRGSAIMAVGLLRALGVQDAVSGKVAFTWPLKISFPDDTFEARTWVSPNGDVLRYRYGHPPKGAAGQRHPLVIGLHGAGSRGEDNAGPVGGFMPLLRPMIAKTPCYVVIPQVPGGLTWATYGWSKRTHTMQPEPSPVMAMTRAVIDRLLAEEAVDPDRIYVTGMSMGGYGTWEMTQRWPDLFAAAIPICGGGDVALAPKVAKLPIWVWHGGKDDIITSDKSKNMVEAIKAAGGDPRFTFLPEAGHDTWTPCYANPEVATWLLAQRRKSR